MRAGTIYSTTGVGVTKDAAYSTTTGRSPAGAGEKCPGAGEMSLMTGVGAAYTAGAGDKNTAKGASAAHTAMVSVQGAASDACQGAMWSFPDVCVDLTGAGVKYSKTGAGATMTASMA